MMKRVKVIALFGKSGSGKDTVLKMSSIMLRSQLDLHAIVSYTTRPKREREEEGIDYHFVSKEKFIDMIDTGTMLEFSCFNGWYYGTSVASLSPDEVNIGVFNLDGIKALKANSHIDLIPIHIDCSDETRLRRQLDREQKPNVKEIVRRFGTDEKDFQDWQSICPEAFVISTEGENPLSSICDLWQHCLPLLDKVD